MIIDMLFSVDQSFFQVSDSTLALTGCCRSIAYWTLTNITYKSGKVILATLSSAVHKDLKPAIKECMYYRRQDWLSEFVGIILLRGKRSLRAPCM